MFGNFTRIRHKILGICTKKIILYLFFANKFLKLSFSKIPEIPEFLINKNSKKIFKIVVRILDNFWLKHGLILYSCKIAAIWYIELSVKILICLYIHSLVKVDWFNKKNFWVKIGGSVAAILIWNLWFPDFGRRQEINDQKQGFCSKFLNYSKSIFLGIIHLWVSVSSLQKWPWP